MREVKPFTLYYFVLRILATNPLGLDLGDLKGSLSKQQCENDDTEVKIGSLHGTLSKLKSAGLIQTTIDIVLNDGNEEPVRKYLVTSKGLVFLNNAIKKINVEHQIVTSVPADAIAESPGLVGV